LITLDGLIVGIRNSSGDFAVHTDHQGSVRFITKSTGAPYMRMDYSPYGYASHYLYLNGTTPMSFTNLFRVGYLGERLDTEIGNLLYLHARYYDPSVGQFISPDPSSPDQDGVGLNRYAYAMNNPINFQDSTGLYAAPAPSVIGGGSGFGGIVSGSAWSGIGFGSYYFGGGNTSIGSTTIGIGGGQIFIPANSPYDVQLHSGTDFLSQVTIDKKTGNTTAILAENTATGSRFTCAGSSCSDFGSGWGMVSQPASGVSFESKYQEYASQSILLKGAEFLLDFAPTPQTKAAGLLFGLGIKANKARGDAFRDEIADLVGKDRDVQTEVVKQTPFGKRVIDIEVSKNGKVLGGIETKTGNSRYSASQRAKDEWLRQNGYPVDLVRDRR
jgi:RHS repeat-associated protein